MEQTGGAPQAEARPSLINIPGFWKAQQRDWRVTVARTSLERLGYQMVYPYLSIFIVALGASTTQLGVMTSLGMILAGLLGPITGQLIDRSGPKMIYLIGIGILFASYCLYAAAPAWPLAALAMMLYYVGQGTGSHSCATICGNCLANCDRAKGMLICESLAAGILGMLGPSLAGWVMVGLMGVEGTPGASDIRPLFYIAGGITALSFIVALTRLSNRRWSAGAKSPRVGNTLRDGLAMLKSDKKTVKWLIIASVGNVPAALVLPYVQLFAAEVKGADAGTLAAMVTASALTSVLCGYFAGALSDRIGRKKTLYITTPLFILSNLILIFASSPAMLILSGILQGFYYIGSPLAGTIARELVPTRIMGRWLGVTRFVTSMFSAAVAAVSGIIYDRIGPQYVFIIYIAAEACIRLPLLISLPETLHYKVDEEAFKNVE